MKKLLLPLFTGLLVTACGSDTPPTPDTNNRVTGQFKDANTAGLQYSTASHAGVTDINGYFEYVPGETITFYVGGVTIGSVTGRELITPIDLVANGSSTNPKVLNIVRFLMMLDSDGNSENNIQISDAVYDSAASWLQLDFESATFETDIANMVSDAVAADGGTHSVPTTTEAQSHMEGTYRCVLAGLFTGTFSGDDNGHFGYVLNTLNGEPDGLGYSNGFSLNISLTDATPIDYTQQSNFLVGDVSSGASFDGQYDDLDTISGTWVNSSLSGTFTGTRQAEYDDTEYKFSAKMTGDRQGYMHFALNGTQVQGMKYEVLSNTLSDVISGAVSGNDLTATFADGTSLTATLDFTNEIITGTWTVSDSADTGSAYGAGCKYN